MFATQKLLVQLGSNLHDLLCGAIRTCMLLFKSFQNFTKTFEFSVLKDVGVSYGLASIQIN